MNPNPYQMDRRGVVPLDAQQEEYVPLSSPKFTEVSLNVLKHDEAIRNRLNCKFVELQLIRIIISN